MSPSAAIESPVFLFYVSIVLGLLVVAGLVLAVLRWGLDRDVEHAWQSYRGWLLMIPLLVIAIFLGRGAAITFMTIVAIFGFKEFARATGLYADWYMTGSVYLGIIAVGLTCLVYDPSYT